MTTNGSMVTAALVLLAFAAWASVVVVIPWVMTSLFRYQLWQARDAVTDALIAGELPYHPRVVHLRSVIDAMIVNPGSVTPIVLLPVLISLRPAMPAPPGPSSDGLSDTEKESVRLHERVVGQAAVRHLLAGSPSGWIAAVILWPIVWLRRLRGGSVPRWDLELVRGRGAEKIVSWREEDRERIAACM